ncbi:secretogranin-1 [Protobothrops mucrosquamatus]|uniref:secretogranin-1 n=1 Tax=Protobothrops mucrosquamatus TaxID=103944 RepID=UPI0007759B4B|nr:secretogranin-1 [Protobothrops mucrosquamatus]
MVPCVALLSLLGFAVLAGIHSAPVENDDHTGEMITRCIIEVLLNSLSKGNSPLINPQCKELLKKGEQQKQKEKNIQQGMELGARTLSESEELRKQSEGTVREEQDVSEEEFKRQAGGDAKWHQETKKYGGSSNQQTASQGTSFALDRAPKEEKKNENGKEAEEDNYKRNHHNGDGGKEKKVSEEVESEPLEKKSVLTSGKMDEDDYKHSYGQKYVEEIIQSQERENEDNEEEEEEEEKEEEEEEEESNEKYHHSFHEEFEDSSEKDGGETEKQGHKSGHYRRKPRLGKSSEYNSHHIGEKRGSSEEPSEEESEFWAKRSHHPNHYEREHYFVEPRNAIEMHRSEEMERESRNKGYWDQQYPSQEDSDEDMKHHSEENERRQYQYMRKRLFGGPSREIRHHHEVRVPYSKARQENGGTKQSHDSLDEKRHHDQPNVQLEMAKPQNKEREDGEQRLNSQEAREEKHYPNNDGELETPHYSERGKHFDNKRTLLLEEGYPRSHYLVENVKRALNPYYYQQPRWKSRSVDKNADIINPLLESEEERKSHLNKREFFPEYNDYDLWEKKQVLASLNPKQDNSNNPERLYKPEIKRQYDRMDELAHLLSYRKKSAEFPELYNSKEDIERGHVIRSGKDKFHQRPLTPEEEKELENLAAMDLELQKIAEKFNNNQRG